MSDSQAIITFDPPTDTGGLEITSYTVTVIPTTGAGFTIDGNTSPITVTGLTNGDEYTFTVHATNANGDGPESSPSATYIPSSSLV